MHHQLGECSHKMWFGPVDGWIGPMELIERMDEAFREYSRRQPLKWRQAMRALNPVPLRVRHHAQAGSAVISPCLSATPNSPRRSSRS